MPLPVSCPASVPVAIPHPTANRDARGHRHETGSALRYHAPVPYRDGSLKAREFTFLCEDRILAALPPGLPPPERRVRWTMLQLHFGDARTHFELQPRMKHGVVEAGLHFEGPPDANAAWAELLAAHAADLLGELGPAWELEEWTASWRRLHRTFPFARLTPELAGEVSAELARAMATLHPLIVAGGGAPQARAERPLRSRTRGYSGER